MYLNLEWDLNHIGFLEKRLSSLIISVKNFSSHLENDLTLPFALLFPDTFLNF